MPPLKVYAHHRDQLKKMAVATGIRQTARQCGLTPNMVSRFVRGECLIAARDFYALACGLGCRLNLGTPK